MIIAFGVVLAYLVGSIPSAFLAGKYSRGIDLRKHGSGNLGATNVYRVLGGGLAAAVWVADSAKGAACVLLIPALLHFPASPFWPIVLGMAAMFGHSRPLFLGSGGGKGVATAMGVFMALSWLPATVALLTWVVVLWRTGYVSLASLVAATTLTLSIVAIDGIWSPLLVAALAVTIFVFWSHRENIRRLRSGEEHRFTGVSSTTGSSRAAATPRGGGGQH